MGKIGNHQERIRDYVMGGSSKKGKEAMGKDG